MHCIGTSAWCRNEVEAEWHDKELKAGTLGQDSGRLTR